jgi:tetratricopeptide (TPR) repeat protein
MLQVLKPLFFSSLMITLHSNDFDPGKVLRKASSLQPTKPLKALGLLKQAYFVRYPGPGTQQRLFQGFHAAIKKLITSRKFKEVKPIIEDALTFSPKDRYPFLRYQMIVASEEQDYNQCIVYADEIATTLRPTDDTRFFKGQSYYKLKAFKLAIENFDQITDKFEGLRTVYALTGDSYYHRGEYEYALESFEKAQKIKPTPDLVALITKIKSSQKLEQGYAISPPSPYFVIRTSKEKLLETTTQIQDILNGVYQDLAQTLIFYPETPVSVVVYEADKRDWVSGLKNPSWSAGVYDGEIRIPRHELNQDDVKIETLLRHEIMHLFLDGLTRHSIPTWFNEGIAQYYERPFSFEGDEAFEKREDAPLPKGFKQRLSKAFKGKGLYNYQALAGSFQSLKRDGAVLAYAQSLLMVKYFIESQGLWKLQRLLRDIFLGTAFEVGFKTQTGLNPDEFYAKWKQFQKGEWKL